MNRHFHKLFVAVAVLLATINLSAQKKADVADAIQQRIESGIEQGKLNVSGIELYNQDSIPNFYISREFEPVWSDKKNRDDFQSVIMGAFDHGLFPEDYHLEAILTRLEKVNNGDKDPALQADIDLLMTDAISLYASHLLYGKVAQSKLRSEWEVPANPGPDNPDALLQHALDNNTLPELMSSVGPQHFMYKHLKKGLKTYREIEENGGWPAIPAGETLKKGMTGDRVALMRKRLEITGDLTESEPDSADIFDQALEDAVKRFQFRNNLTQDGVVGKGTLEQMNVPVEERIDQIRINMERARWVMHHLEDDFLVVNIAGFNLRRVTNNEVVYYSPVIVGRRYHESPVFKATMQYFVINPTWTVPYSIATKETLPKLQKDPGYLDKHNMIIMDRNGKKLNPYDIDFHKYSRNNFPFTVRQEPGPNNALGEVKFIFPNPYNVYVHDTPGRTLFSREDRAFSHGCIRLQKKWELLLSLMQGQDDWNMDKINEILASGKTTTVHLPDPIDILILYWTAGADREDRIFFNKDVYSRDDEVLTALDTPWEF